ncbi:hypothetical protein LCGC14_2419540, partial [marine sediment metagenome]
MKLWKIGWRKIIINLEETDNVKQLDKISNHLKKQYPKFQFILI